MLNNGLVEHIVLATTNESEPILICKLGVLFILTVAFLTFSYLYTKLH